MTHLFALIFFWNSETEKRTIIKLSTPLYIALTIHLTAWFGIIAFPVVLFCGAVLIIGFAAEFRSLMDRFRQHNAEVINIINDEKIDEWGRFATLSPWNFSWWPVLVQVRSHVAGGQLMVEANSADEHLDSIVVPEEKEKPLDVNSLAESVENVSESNRYLAVLWKAFLVVQLWKNAGLIPLIILPTVYAFVKRAVPQLLWYQATKRWLTQTFEDLKSSLGDRSEALIPRPVVGLCKMASYGDRKILKILGQSMDEASANLMICLMFVFFILTAGFVVVQVQQETVYMVRLSGTLGDMPTYSNYLI